ncbi:MAG TPA: hypothetical protein VEK80_10125 [Kribbellaceae bacterium]|nr:hypothetical protein [Jatrophihabitantaceae bacterium]HYU85154.1 hypothetical protein [Kribbellaceae bacterium]
MNISAFADLLASRGLRLLPGSHAVPVEVLAELPDGTVAHFAARGRTLRLALHSPAALHAITIPTECGCGRHHEPSGPQRTGLRAGAVPLVEHTIDGELAFGWTGHEAGLLRLADAASYFFALLDRVGDDARSRARELVGVA